MAYPQGINFRNTLAFVTDVSPADCEVTPFATLPTSYPRTTAQGNTVGWEAVPASGGSRDRNDAIDARLAGIVFGATGGTADYRFDLPATGNYNIRMAMGDNDVNRSSLRCSIIDDTTSLGEIINGNALAANWIDASNVSRSAAAWPTDNAVRALTFATTICRVRVSAVGQPICISHAYVESAGPSTTPITVTLSDTYALYR